MSLGTVQTVLALWNPVMPACKMIQWNIFQALKQQTRDRHRQQATQTSEPEKTPEMTLVRASDALERGLKEDGALTWVNQFIEALAGSAPEPVGGGKSVARPLSADRLEASLGAGITIAGRVREHLQQALQETTSGETQEFIRRADVSAELIGSMLINLEQRLARGMPRS